MDRFLYVILNLNRCNRIPFFVYIDSAWFNGTMNHPLVNSAVTDTLELLRNNTVHANLPNSIHPSSYIHTWLSAKRLLFHCFNSGGSLNGRQNIRYPFARISLCFLQLGFLCLVCGERFFFVLFQLSNTEFSTILVLNIVID